MQYTGSSLSGLRLYNTCNLGLMLYLLHTRAINCRTLGVVEVMKFRLRAHFVIHMWVGIRELTWWDELLVYRGHRCSRGVARVGLCSSTQEPHLLSVQSVQLLSLGYYNSSTAWYRLVADHHDQRAQELASLRLASNLRLQCSTTVTLYKEYRGITRGRRHRGACAPRKF